MMDDMVSNQISVSLTVDDDTEKKEAYATADKVMDAILKVKGIDKVGAMDGNAGATSSVLGGAGGNYTSFTFSVITDEDIKTTGQFKKIIKEIEELNLGEMTPIEGLNYLFKLQNQLKNRW